MIYKYVDFVMFELLYIVADYLPAVEIKISQCGYRKIYPVKNTIKIGL